VHAEYGAGPGQMGASQPVQEQHDSGSESSDSDEQASASSTQEADGRDSVDDVKGSAKSSAIDQSSVQSFGTSQGHREDSVLFCACCGSGMRAGAKEYLNAGSAPQMPTQSFDEASSVGEPAQREAKRTVDDKSDSRPERTQHLWKNEAGQRGRGGRCRNARGNEEGEEDDNDGAASVGARSARSDFSVGTAIVVQHNKGQSDDAASLKAALKVFVRGMIQGRELHLQPRSGEVRPMLCRMSPEVDAILIGDPKPQRVAFQDISHVHHGLEAVPLDLQFELNASMMVLELSSGNCVSFNLGHPIAAEEFVLYMRLLTAYQRQQKQRLPQSRNHSDNDDARSECSVQTAVVRQQLTATPLSSAAAADPREAKRMFKMFTETMKRGKEFYVVKVDGRLHDVECSLSQSHDEFRMRWDFECRVIPLCDILNVLTSAQASSLNLGFALDEHCATVELRSGECITFKFGHTEACERFLFCMRILVDQKRKRFVSAGLGGPAAGQANSGAGSDILGPASARSSGGGGEPGRRGGDGGGAPASSRSSHRSSPTSAREDPRAVVETFVREMVAGCRFNVIGSGASQEVECSMDTDLKSLKIVAVDGSRREVEVVAVKAVHVGSEAKKIGLEGVAIDDLCATLELISDDFLTIRFSEAAQRDRFVFCLRTFASARRK